MNVSKREPRSSRRSALRRFNIGSCTAAIAATYPFERDIENVQFGVARVPATTAKCGRSGWTHRMSGVRRKAAIGLSCMSQGLETPRAHGVGELAFAFVQGY